ncbi:MAG: flagellar hook-associated protein FlgL [Oligoflexia bacterium]|nr:flagellar hook-associated protein FlgL [Oligoflexia bacterium]
MTRVSDKSGSSAIEFALNKAKSKMEDLHLKGAGIKRIVRPSDDPAGNIEIMQLRTKENDLTQYSKNASMASISLEYTEEALNDLTEILMKAKEIAIGQASNFYNGAIRKSVAEEVTQLKKQAMGVANRHLGNRYIFAGHRNETRPFELDGKYVGNGGVIYLEISKNFYVPTNIPGNEIFYYSKHFRSEDVDPLQDLKRSENNNEKKKIENKSAEGDKNKSISESKHPTGKSSTENDIGDTNKLSINSNNNNDINNESAFSLANKNSIFSQLQILINALNTNDHENIQNLLENLESSIDRVITLRTKIGSILNTIKNSNDALENYKVTNSLRKSTLEDADVAELFTDIEKQNNVLKAVYKTSSEILNENLLSFLK